MKTLKQLTLGILAIMTIGIMAISCGDDGTDVCTEADIEGTWVGKYKVAGLITLPNNDTITITITGNTVTINSQLLGGQAFMADYDPSTGEISIDNINISSIAFGDDEFTDISVDSGSVVLSSDCLRLFLSLEGVLVGGGTIDLPPPLTYPLGAPNGTTIETTGAGFVKQL